MKWFEGLLPPVVAAPAFAIRKPAVAVFTLADYAAAEIMSADQAAISTGGCETEEFLPHCRNARTVPADFEGRSNGARRRMMASTTIHAM